jgi:hypothetical protein
MCDSQPRRDRPSDAPIFVSVITALIGIGMVVALIPGIPVIKLLVGCRW